jgi:YhcG PDDEXK nuclease domain
VIVYSANELIDTHKQKANLEFRLDLLFYHLKLRCYVVIELKTRNLEPGHVSHLGFYMNDMLRTADDKPTIGLVMSK